MDKGILHELADLKDTLYRDGWGSSVDPDTAHVRDVLDTLIRLLEEHFAREVERG